MRTLIILTFLLQSVISIGQKNYQIEKVFWSYTKPQNYKIRVDNFSSAIRAGDSLINKNNKLEKQASTDNILFAFSKNDSIDINIIMADYKSNSNIVKYTLKGYIDKLVDFMKSNFAKMGSDAKISTKEVFIDKIKFYVLESKIVHKEKNYTYWTEMYITELSKKELTIAVAYDNEKDKKILVESISRSRFTTK